MKEELLHYLDESVSHAGWEECSRAELSSEKYSRAHGSGIK
jgi:hypothetical protein